MRPAPIRLPAIDLAADTPRWLLLEDVARERFGALDRAVRASSCESRVSVAYSIKTNPHPCLLKLARDLGWLAEAISQAEVDAAARAGFKLTDIVLNGPGKWWPRGSRQASVHTLFCDSIEELARVRAVAKEGNRPAETVGVRLCPPGLVSRFGIELKPWRKFQTLVDELRRLPEEGFGVHFHIAPSVIGASEWWRACESILQASVSLEKLTGKHVVIFDVGGGWAPEEWQAGLVDRLTDLVIAIGTHLSTCREIIIEPGKALTQPAGVVLTRVLEIRRHREKRELVVDACIGDLPDNSTYPHRVFHHSGRDWRQLSSPGRWRILGRSCMEHDILAEDVTLPRHVGVGEMLAIADAGAYDRSMAFSFGAGE